jgi:hypothetical protein
MTRMFNDSELAGYLDEALPQDLMAEVEQATREDVAIVSRLSEIRARQDAGIHSVSEIWRRHRLSCPTREQWGSYLLGVLDEEQARFFRVHLEIAGCRYCRSNLLDLQSEQGNPVAVAEVRRTKYFQSSAGKLRAQTR